MNSQQVRDKILNSTTPLVFKKSLNWNIVHWSLQDWKELLKNEEMEFRLGTCNPVKEPQWERNTEVIKGKFDFFLNQTQIDTDKWLYFDYKYLNNILLSATNLRNDITWGALGFPEISVNESTLWIGSKAAHTPCHVDTYGFNLVCQIYGRKLWVLFPPEENLRPTRVPYEESSIYSELNFFCPTMEDFQAITNAYILTLEPGDVLYVPHGWWHYVENLETAISINAWIGLPEDDLERVKEALVQFLVKQVCDSSQLDVQNEILNPNMEEILKQEPNSFVDTILKTTNIYKTNKNNSIKKIKIASYDYKTNQSHANENLIDPNCIIEVSKATQKEWINFLNAQSNRFANTDHGKAQKPKKIKKEILQGKDTIKLLKALTDPEVIALIQYKLLRNNC